MADEPTVGPGIAPAEPPAAPPTPDPIPPPAPLPVAQSAPPATPAPGPSSVVRDQLVARGLDASGFPTDEAAMDALVGAAQRGQQDRQHAELGQRMAPHVTEFEAWQKEKEAASQPAPPPAAAEPEWSWKAPEWDPAWARYVNPDGTLDPNVDPVIGHKIATALSWEQQTYRDIVHDPRKKLGGMHDERFGKIDKRFEGLQPDETIEQSQRRVAREELAAHGARQKSDAYFAEHMKEFYVVDAQGKPLTDPTTGQWAETPKGKAFREHAQRAQQFGLTDEDAIREYALGLTGADEATGRVKATPPGQPPAPTPPPTNPKETFLQAALQGQSLPAADGTVPAPNDPAPPDVYRDAMSIAEDVLREAGDIP